MQASPALQQLLLTRLTHVTHRGVAEIRITPYRHGVRRFWCVMALGHDRREIPLPQGGAQRISRVLRAAFPEAAWSSAQDYDAATGVLTEHVPAIPACLLDGAQ